MPKVTKVNKQYLTDESGLLVVPLAYSDELKEIRLRSPKGKDIKAIQRLAKQQDDLDDITMLQISVVVLSQPTVTIEQMDELDASDMMEVGEALSSFRFFIEMQAK